MDTTPGKILALALVANAPFFLGFVLLPLFRGPEAALPFRWPILLGTPPVAAWAIVTYARAPAERKTHRAARMGVLLAGVALFLWLLVLVVTLLRP